MAHKEVKLTDAGAARYRTRMLTAGDTVTLPGPKARLFEALGYVEPASADAPVEPAEKVAPTPTAPPRKRKARKAK